MTTTPSLSAEIVTTGTEILLGDIVDTNAAWIAQQLREIGVNIYYKTTVGDNEGRVRGVLEMVLARSDVAIVTGGLGPTADDITRDAIANATGCPLVRDEAIIEALRQRFQRWGSTMSENNARQGYLPQGCTIVENRNGTAPGFIVQDQRQGRNAYVIALPGVPREMKQMMTDTVIPFLLQLQGGQAVIRRRILRTIGIGESAIDAQIHDLMLGANPTVGTAAHTGQADIRIAARAGSITEAEALIDEMDTKIRQRIGPFIYSTTPDETIEAAVARLLAQHDVSVALLESTSARAVAARLTAALDDPSRVKAALTVNDEMLPADLIELIGGDRYDEQIARSAAEILRRQSEATYAIVALGSGRPEEHFYATDPGESWIALAGPNGVRSLRYPFGGRDEITVIRLGNQIYDLIRRAILAIHP
ncbi:MAG: CinA family nicotinamide mononucleotide deamidase-related protein [Caldilineaceae bacterium]|nr:CinA family nicotinamide mononucleotide deamidase-related protein [Caldilineaceae bacterium]